MKSFKSSGLRVLHPQPISAWTSHGSHRWSLAPAQETPRLCPVPSMATVLPGSIVGGSTDRGQVLSAGGAPHGNDTTDWTLGGPGPKQPSWRQETWRDPFSCYGVAQNVSLASQTLMSKVSAHSTVTTGFSDPGWKVGKPTGFPPCTGGSHLPAHRHVTAQQCLLGLVIVGTLSIVTGCTSFPSASPPGS